MKKKILIGLSIATVIGLAVLGWTSKTTELSIVSPSPTPVIVLPTLNPQTNIPQKDIISDASHDYAIVYDPVYDAYTINILNTPFDKIRIASELALLKKLNLTKTDACSKIKVSIGSPRFVNPNQPSYDTFSFCSK